MTATLTELFSTAAIEHKDRVAVEDPSNGDSVTYHQLSELVDDLRDVLVRAGVGRGDRVGICAPKSISSVASLFAALDAGAAYVPVDSSAPPRRNAGIFADCSVRVALVERSLVGALLNAWEGRPFDVVDEWREIAVLRSREDAISETTFGGEITPEDVAYILYTSGSTGKPKGVVHTHSSALGFIDWCSVAFTPSADDRFSSHAPFHFDLSIFDLYVSTKHGATLVLVPEDIGKQPLRLGSLISESRVTVWYSTPSVLSLLAEYGKLAERDFGALRLVLFAGEVFPLKHLRALKSRWPSPRYFNLYGPTETNVCTYCEIPLEIPPERSEAYPIGFPCSGDRTKIVCDDGTDAPPGSEGELVVEGTSVMKGYWNLPERTAEAFLVDSGGARWYRTGDVVRYTADDGYIFVGRRDRMVKRRGYRVELGEIEAALYRHHLAEEAAVTAISDSDGGVRIIAHLSLSDGPRPSVVEMKRFCSENLPAYMIPDRFIFHESLPKTSTDKLDYERLRQLA